MRPVRALLLYTIAVFLGGALIAPWLYWLAQSTMPRLAQAPFHRFLDRSLLIVALIGIWPLLKSIGAKSTRDFGLVKPTGQWKLLANGFLLGFASLAIAACIVLAAHARSFNSAISTNKLLAALTSAALTAVVVAVLEEILFRGAIFGALRKIWNWRAALVISSMIYAIVHFLAKADLSGAITWTSGFQLLPLKLAGFAALRIVIPGFFNLTLAGAMLALAYQRTGNLYFSIGLHAGWIFWLKFYGVLTAPLPDANVWLWGTGKLIDGWFALAVLAVTFFILLRLLPDKYKQSPP
jgi:membrane protease YdiL (CAAX protease family)